MFGTNLAQRADKINLALLQRMGGFKRVAAALELAFLPARRGRSAAGAWSPGDVQSPLALVQFGSSQHPVSISEAPLLVPPGSPLPGCQDRNASGEGDAAAGPEREHRAARLEAEREVRSGGGSDSLGTEVSNEQLLHRTALQARRGRAAMLEATPRRNIALGSPIPTGRPPFTIGMRTGSGAAGLGEIPCFHGVHALHALHMPWRAVSSHRSMC